jgi:hypothetical protein
MKKILLLVVLFAWISGLAQRHQDSHSCGTDLVWKAMRDKNPKAFNAAETSLNAKISQRINAKAGQRMLLDVDSPIIIPVVIHVVHNGEATGSGTNISYAQIKSQIDALNAAYSNYSDLPNYLQAGVGNSYDVPERRGVYGIDTGIRFCLAPNTGPIAAAGVTIPGQPGVIRYNSAALSRHDMSEAGQEALMNLTHPNASILPSQKYFNIWIVTAIRNGGASNSGDVPGIEGYAPIPVDYPYVNNGWPLRGVVVRSDVFGDNSVNSNNFTLQPNLNSTIGGSTGFIFNRGKILAHEVGHALGLYHVFHTYAQTTVSPCDLNGGDLVGDTPPCSMNNLGLYILGQPFRNTCNTDSPDGNDMVENFMYYSDDQILNTFTPGQKERLQAVINEIYPELSGDENIIATGVVGTSGCFGPILSASFLCPQAACTGLPIAFSGIQSPGNSAITWHWTTQPATGVLISSPNAPSTTITFNGMFDYVVSLTTTDGLGGTKTVSKNIFTSSCVLNACAVKNGNTHMIFGNGTHLDFSSGTPEASTDAYGIDDDDFFSVEGNFTQSDENGNLLFYTDGNWVWNAQHQVINSANPLSVTSTPNPWMYISESVHQITGAPFPGHPNQYILLIPPSSEEYVYFSPGKFKYALVDFSGPTPIVTGPFTIQSGTGNRIHEMISVIPHCNGIDYWVIICKRQSNTLAMLYSYLLSAAGIKLVTTTNVATNDNNSLSPWAYGLSASRDGSKLLALLEDRIYVMDFNSTSGGISGLRPLFKNIPDVTVYDYQAAFSASGNKLYLKAKNTIRSYEITPTQLTLLNPALYVAAPETQWDITGLFLGPDDNIYIPDNKATNCTFIQAKSLTRIADANSTAPVVTPNFLNFTSTNYCSGILLGMPTSIDGCVPDRQTPEFSVTKLSCNQVSIALSGCFNQYDVSINWGDASVATTGLFADFLAAPPTHTYAAAGNYNVTLTFTMTAGLGDANNDLVLDPNSITLATVSEPVAITEASGSILGSTSVCPGSQSVQYICNAGTTGNYNWTVTGAGNNISGTVSGIGINTVNVNWQNSGTLGVTYNEGSCSFTKQLAVSYACLGIDSHALLQLSYSPNPVHGLLTIKLNTAITYITVFNVLGQQVLKKSYNAPEIVVDFSALANATYFVKVESGERQAVIKVIKQ